MTSNSSNIYMILLDLHKNIMEKLSNDNNYSFEKLKELKEVLKLYNDKLQKKQNNEGSINQNISHPTKVHILIGAYYKSLYFIIVEFIGLYGILKDNTKNINTIITNISNVSKILYKIDKIISNHIINNTNITLNSYNDIEDDKDKINNIIQFNTDEYESIIKVCEKYQPDLSIKTKKYTFEMVNENEKYIDKLDSIKIKEDLYAKFDNKDSYAQYHTPMEEAFTENEEDGRKYIRSIIYSIKKNKIPFINHINIMKNIKDFIILPWFNRLTITINDDNNEYETKDNIFKAWISSPFVDIHIMNYIKQIYYGSDEKEMKNYDDLKWTLLHSKEQLYEWYEIGEKDKQSIYDIFKLNTDEYDKISYNEKMLLWSAINMVLRQHWKISLFQKGEIWKNNPQCIDIKISDKLIKQTIYYINKLVNDDDKTKSLLAKIMGFIHNNDSENEEKKYIKTEYLKKQYDLFLKKINNNIYSIDNPDNESEFSLYLNLFNDKYDNEEKNNKNDNNNDEKDNDKYDNENMEKIIDKEEEDDVEVNNIENQDDDDTLKELIDKKVNNDSLLKEPKKSFNLTGGRKKKKNKKKKKKTRRLKIRKKTKRKYKKRKNKKRKTRKKKRTRRKLKIKIKKKKRKTKKKKSK